MRKLVVTTESGEFIVQVDVEEQDLAPVVLAYLRMFPTAAFYFEGQLVPAENLAALKAAVAAGTPASSGAPHRPSAAPPLEPEVVQDYNETLQRAFDDVRRANVASMREMAEVTRLFSAVIIEQQRQFADEAVRQRELTRKSLADVDLLGRSVAATEFQNVLAMAGPNRGRRGGTSITLTDLFRGAKRIVTGEK